MVDEIYTAEFEDTGLPTLGWFGCYLAWETAEGEKKNKVAGDNWLLMGLGLGRRKQTHRVLREIFSASPTLSRGH